MYVVHLTIQNDEMSLLKNREPSPLSIGDHADIINQNYGGPRTALRCEIKGIHENGKVTCRGISVIDERGEPCLFSHNDEEIMSKINRVGEQFEEDQLYLHPLD